MKPLFMVFIDGLKADSVEHMPFLNSFEVKRRMRTELGYSPTCYASMWSGVYPNKHHVWLSWLYSPTTSPYKWLRKYKIDRLPHCLFTRYLLFKISNYLAGNILPWQGPMPLQWWYIPVSIWHLLDTSLKRSWFQLNFLGKYPTVFDILTKRGIQYELVGTEKVKPEKSWQTMEQYDFSNIKPWTFFFIGDVDELSHHHTQHSDVVIERLGEIDSLLKEKYNLLKSKVGDFYFVLFSDHGHVEIKNYLDLKPIFKSYGESLDDYIFFVDANFARFRFRNEDEERKVRRILSQLGDAGYILTQEDLKRFHLDMPDNRYCDLVFYADAPHHLTAGLKLGWKELRSPFLSAHGYSPDLPDSDGIFVSNIKAREGTHVELVDIMPSILDIFGIEIPTHVDGRVIWS
jgi:predicted AlkP superfamily pyrophosphatase or phosphodiesterase